MKILLTTLNARYAHSAIGLRYLYANLKEFQEDASILEFSINDAMQSVAEQILDTQPDLIGIGVYIWNALEVAELVHLLKKISPQTLLVLGGPEVSYTPFRIPFTEADYIIQGEGELSFYELCKELTSQDPTHKKTQTPHIIPIKLPKLKELTLPYQYYTDEDIKNRYIYVEISRGCPFLCEFCLSSMDEKVRTFDIDKVIEAFETLWQRGARNFKFVDRTFNINIRVANKILDFFLAKEPPYFAHFEVIPDHFPQALREKIKLFPHGALQLEIGIQTLNTQIAANISRDIKRDKIEENIAFLENETHAHIHLDLIVGLPRESLESFGANLDALVRMSSCEIQIGILKKLSGTHIDRHDIPYEMVYSDIPPYDILKNSQLSFKEIQIMKRFARFWDITYNSGNFKRTMPLLWQDESVFENFYSLGLWIYEQTRSTYKISLDRMGELLFTYLTEMKKLPHPKVADAMAQDLLTLKGRALPKYLSPYIQNKEIAQKQGSSSFNKRQNKL
ncbi:MAG: DUF4080 domain-containing protein [Sulfurimonas sp.]|jgi:hypothetical protein|nr:DUF4080 domain-containing protein [Sulfurimonas sp.]